MHQSGSAAHFSRPTILMCAPTHFDVEYEINPWMVGNTHKVSRDRAQEQWTQLYNTIAQLADVRLLESVKGQPDLVFTANAGIVYDDIAIPARFRPAERQGEEPLVRRWFGDNGFKILEVPKGEHLEGAGDALFDRDLPLLWTAYGHRSDLSAHQFVARELGVEIAALELTDERFYHLDTCFCPLDDGYAMYYPAAMTPQSVATIESILPDDKRIVVSDADAQGFACNAVSIDRNVILSPISPELSDRLAAAHFKVHQIELSQFMFGGGSAKCLTLRLDDGIANSI